MKNKLTIEYNWSEVDGNPIKNEHMEALEESATSRIFDQLKDGYTSGELQDVIRMSDEDGEDGIEYTGWWDLTTQRID